MLCPVCKTEPLRNERLEGNLWTSRCGRCGGQWLKAEDYWRWREVQGDKLPEKPAGEAVPLPVCESNRAKLCPNCGHILTRYKVGHDLPFTLDRCGSCAGIWFDRNEWESLKSRNLHDAVHMVFSDAWQAQIRHAEHARARERWLLERFGENDLAELRRIRDWINAHPKAIEIRAFLDEDLTPPPESAKL
jgi:Zn-finger nucleic acid-binding protein